MLISSQQTAYVKIKFIGEIDILNSEISDWLNIEGFLVTLVIEKAFDSLDHDFLCSVIKNVGFDKNFITSI